jgi:putative sigma-54 modulation protein
MNTTITFRHMQPSEALKDHVGERLERLRKYARDPVEVHVILDIEKNRHTAEVILTAKGVNAQSSITSEDMYTSVEAAIDKVEKNLRRHHDKKITART